MARNRREQGNDPVSTPAQKDEADIVAEVGALQDDESGELIADEAKVIEAGAVSASAIIENRRIEEIVDKKRGHVKGVQFNIDDPLLQYEAVIKTWPPNTLDIYVKRLTGAPKSDTITSRPRSGVELYEALKLLHGEHEEASYALKFFDSHGKQIRGNGQITMPDTRPPKPPQGQPMQPYPYGPPGYPPQAAVPQQPAQQQLPPVVQVVPPATDPMAMMQQMFKLFQQMQASVQPPQQPLPQQPAPQQPAMPVTGASADPVAMMQQMFQMFQQMQASVQPPQQPLPQQPQATMPPPPQSSDPAAMMAWMQQVFQMFQQMQASVQPQPQPTSARATQQQPQQAMNPMLAMMGGMPPMQPPPGTIWVPGIGFVPMEALAQAMGGGSAAGRPGPVYRGPYTGPRPYYGPPGGPQDPANHGGPAGPYGGYPGGHLPQQQPPQPKSAADQFREAISVVRTAAESVAEIQSIFPGQQPAQAEPPDPEEDVSPVKVMDVGEYKLVLDKKDGHARLWETGWANMGPVLKWVGEQREAIQKSNAERQQPKQQLPPGYVEVTPGYQPPPGYVAIPVDQIPPQQIAQGGLPQPPAQMPPPIGAPPPNDPQRRTWGRPTIPGGG